MAKELVFFTPVVIVLKVHACGCEPMIAGLTIAVTKVDLERVTHGRPPRSTHIESTYDQSQVDQLANASEAGNVVTVQRSWGQIPVG